MTWMVLVMATKYHYNRHVKLTLTTSSGSKLVLESTNVKTRMCEIHFSLPFSSDPTPNVCTVSIFNLTKKTRDKFKKKCHVKIEVGYGSDIGVLTEGHINKIPPLQWSGVDSEFSFTFIEGTDYSKLKDVSITFKKGASAHTVISEVAKKAKIPLKSIKLQVPKTFKKGYVAEGQPLELIEEVAKKCGSVLRIVRGKYRIIYDDSASDLKKIVKTRAAAERSAHNHYRTTLKTQKTAKTYTQTSQATIDRRRATYKKNLAAAKTRLSKAKTKSGKAAATKAIGIWQKKLAEVGNLKSHANALASYKKRSSEATAALNAWKDAASELDKAQKAQTKAGKPKSNTTAKKPQFKLTFETGLTEEPTYSDDDSGTRWNFSCLLQYRIATDSVIEVKSKSLNKTMIVESGEHNYDGSSMLTTGVLK